MEVPILGVVENMSYVTCPDCGRKIHLFGKGKTAEAAERHHLPLLAEMPVDPELASPGGRRNDRGTSAATGWTPPPTRLEGK